MMFCQSRLTVNLRLSCKRIIEPLAQQLIIRILELIRRQPGIKSIGCFLFFFPRPFPASLLHIYALHKAQRLLLPRKVYYISLFILIIAQIGWNLV